MKSAVSPVAESRGDDGGGSGGRRAVIGLGVGCGGDRDGKLVDGSCGRDKGVGVVGAAVAVVDDSAGGQSSRSCVSAVEELGEVGGVAGAEAAGGDDGRGGGGRGAVIGLGLGCGGDRDGKLVDGSCGRDKGVGVVGAAVAVVDDSARNKGSGPAFRLSKACVKLVVVSPVARLPAVMVGTPEDAVVPS